MTLVDDIDRERTLGDRRTKERLKNDLKRVVGVKKEVLGISCCKHCWMMMKRIIFIRRVGGYEIIICNFGRKIVCDTENYDFRDVFYIIMCCAPKKNHKKDEILG